MIALAIGLTIAINMAFLISMLEPASSQDIKLKLEAVPLCLNNLPFVFHISESPRLDLFGKLGEVISVVLEILVAPDEIACLPVVVGLDEDVLEGALVYGDSGREEIGDHLNKWYYESGRQLVSGLILLSQMINLIEKKFFTDISEFEFHLQSEKKHIGTGSFGVVKLALHRGTNRVYAVKIMDLQELKNEVEWKIIEREIQIHSSLDHPHIVKLWNSLIHEDKVYMIMEYAENGNLFYYQNSKIRFTEPQAFKFFFQTAKAVDYMHSIDVIHRDIKPENLLLDDFFNIKLCDFGWSAYDIRSKRSTFCGTYQYMAPEMLIDKSYDYRIDIWGLGILLYELLHGKAPFRGESAEEIKAQMDTGFEIKDSLSDDAMSLIRGLLQINPEKRISMKEIFAHQWVRKMTEIVNNSIRKQEISHPRVIHPKISEIPAITFKKRHHKTESANNILCPKQKNININFLINNFSMKRSGSPDAESALQTDNQKSTTKQTKSSVRYKTLTQQSEMFKENQYGSGSKHKKRKLKCNLRPSQDLQEAQSQLYPVMRRKSQENVKLSTIKSDPAFRVVTEMQEKKLPSKKKKTAIEDLTKKKMLSTVNLKRLNARPC